VRAGYVVGDAVLIYGRAGVVNSWFETDYAFEDVSVSRDDSEVGLRLGGGVEFALTDRIRMRVDYTRTSYDSYKVDYGAGVDSFDNAENLFRIGLSYAF
jgi:outer membrane immunogenic protein